MTLRSSTFCIWYNSVSAWGADDALIQMTLAANPTNQGPTVWVGDEGYADINFSFNGAWAWALRHMFTPQFIVPIDTWVYISTTYDYDTGENLKYRYTFRDKEKAIRERDRNRDLRD